MGFSSNLVCNFYILLIHTFLCLRSAKHCNLSALSNRTPNDIDCRSRRFGFVHFMSCFHHICIIWSCLFLSTLDHQIWPADHVEVALTKHLYYQSRALFPENVLHINIIFIRRLEIGQCTHRSIMTVWLYDIIELQIIKKKI